jgi:hypothetical protein
MTSVAVKLLEWIIGETLQDIATKLKSKKRRPRADILQKKTTFIDWITCPFGVNFLISLYILNIKGVMGDECEQSILYAYMKMQTKTHYLGKLINTKIYLKY